MDHLGRSTRSVSTLPWKKSERVLIDGVEGELGLKIASYDKLTDRKRGIGKTSRESAVTTVAEEYPDSRNEDCIGDEQPTRTRGGLRG